MSKTQKRTKSLLQEKRAKVIHPLRTFIIPDAIKKDIEAWIRGPQEYDKGLVLLMKVSAKRPIFPRMIKRVSDRSRDKLLTELSNAIELRVIPEQSTKSHKIIL
jgi:hypothetical protein